ncbi:MAG: hypothetical protein ACW967_02420 [Candidatus Hodarchaeales archaeon]
MKVKVKVKGASTEIILSFSAKMKIIYLLIITLLPIGLLFYLYILFIDLDTLISIILDDILILFSLILLLFIVVVSIISFGNKILRNHQFLKIDTQTRQIFREDEIYNLQSDSKIVVCVKHDPLNNIKPTIQIEIGNNENFQMIAFGTINQRVWIKEIAKTISKILDIPFEDISGENLIGMKLIPR